MATLKDRLKSDLTAAMRARDDVRKSTIRMALTSITKAEVSGTESRTLTDDEIISVLASEAKRRREASEAFRTGGRAADADREDAEAAVLAEYLPAALSAEELGSLIDAAVAESGAEGPRDMGKVMKILQPQVRGRADGAAVAAAVQARLRP